MHQETRSKYGLSLSLLRPLFFAPQSIRLGDTLKHYRKIFFDYLFVEDQFRLLEFLKDQLNDQLLFELAKNDKTRVLIDSCIDDLSEIRKNYEDTRDISCEHFATQTFELGNSTSTLKQLNRPPYIKTGKLVSERFWKCTQLDKIMTWYTPGHIRLWNKSFVDLMKRTAPENIQLDLILGNNRFFYYKEILGSKISREEYVKELILNAILS